MVQALLGQDDSFLLVNVEELTVGRSGYVLYTVVDKGVQTRVMVISGHCEDGGSYGDCL